MGWGQIWITRTKKLPPPELSRNKQTRTHTRTHTHTHPHTYTCTLTRIHTHTRTHTHTHTHTHTRTHRHPCTHTHTQTQNQKQCLAVSDATTEKIRHEICDHMFQCFKCDIHVTSHLECDTLCTVKLLDSPRRVRVFIGVSGCLSPSVSVCGFQPQTQALLPVFIIDRITCARQCRAVGPRRARSSPSSSGMGIWERRKPKIHPRH